MRLDVLLECVQCGSGAVCMCTCMCTGSNTSAYPGQILSIGRKNSSFLVALSRPALPLLRVHSTAVAIRIVAAGNMGEVSYDKKAQGMEVSCCI